MTSREQEPLTDQDPHVLLFGPDDDQAPTLPGEFTPDRRSSRVPRKPVGRHRRTFLILSALVVVLLAVVGAVGYRAYQQRFHPKDFSGLGTGSAQIVVHAGDGASAIGSTLLKAGVVASKRAFINAASDNKDAQNISPGTYQLHLHMSASNAVALLLDPNARLSNNVLVFDGATVLDVVGPLAKALGTSTAAVDAAMKDVSALGLPSGYNSGSEAPSSVEGFLYPATYSFDPGTKPADALQEMITKFIDEDRTAGFAAAAKSAGLSPYDALIIASIAEKEAKNPADFAKVARVILNRIAAKMPLQIDATSAYAAKLQHLDPTKVIYAEINSPYNTYTHDGLPPTPIASPGADAIQGAVKATPGNWLYYVNGDKAGNLFFTNSDTEFAKAVEKCRTNHWGCG